MESIPLTDFDQRQFPPISEDDKIKFIIQTNKLERIDVKEELVRSAILIPQKADPSVSGQMRSLGLIEEFAKDPNLLPPLNQVSAANFDNAFPWFVRLHKNVLYDFSRKGQELLNSADYPLPHELGAYRTEDKTLGHRKMPNPFQIKELLASAFSSFIKTYTPFKDRISNPRTIELEDWHELEKAANRLCLDICCIKPFKDGSNRVARLSENLIRLNLGLKLKSYEDKDKILRQIWDHQDAFYRSVE